MVLSKKEIECYCEKGLFTGHLEENIQSCSYDLRMGEEYYYYKASDHGKVNISTLKEGQAFKIPPNAICYIITEEIVNMPLDLTASISLAFGLIKCGVMLAAQPPYDPGYSGKTVALLHNLSDKPVEITRGQHVLNIVFTKLNQAVDSSLSYNGDYNNLEHLETYCKEERIGAVFKLNQELEKSKKRFTNFLPNIMTIITIIIAALTVLITVVFGIQGISSIFQNKTISNPDSYQKFYVDKEHNELIICIDGQEYELNLSE